MYEVFDSLLDVPLDQQTIDDDGDDSLVPAEEAYYPPALFAKLTLTVPSARSIAVPFLGPLKPGMNSKAVKAMARALAHAGYLPWERFVLWNYFGWRKKKALIAFKKDHGLGGNAVYGELAHKALAPYYDQYAIYHLLAGSLDDKQREKFVAQLYYLYNMRYNLPYTQARPYDRRKPPTRGEDCSSAGEWAAEYAGMPSLSGLARGWGNTYSQLSHFKALGRVRGSIFGAKLGDPRYYGSPSHVAFWLGVDGFGTMRVISNGSYPMKILPYDYRSDGNWICDLTGK